MASIWRSSSPPTRPGPTTPMATFFIFFAIIDTEAPLRVLRRAARQKFLVRQFHSDGAARGLRQHAFRLRAWKIRVGSPRHAARQK